MSRPTSPSGAPRDPQSVPAIPPPEPMLSRPDDQPDLHSRSLGKDVSSNASLSDDSAAGPTDVEPTEKPPQQTQSKEESNLELSRTKSSVYPPKRTIFPLMISLYLSILLVALDRTIVGVALPALSNEFHSFGDIGWYGSAYLITTCAPQLVYGRIYTFYNVKWVFMFVIALFELGSLICAVAPSSLAFIWGRAIQGLGGAGVQTGGIAIMIAITPLKDRPAYMAGFGAIFGISSVLGPILGGVFTTDVTWRWCFYINLPLGGLVIIVAFFLLNSENLKRTAPSWREQLKRLDPIGNLLFFPAVVCLLLALQWGGSKYPWANGRIIALFILFGVLSVLWFANQYYQKENATVPAAVIKNRSVYCGLWMTTMIGSTLLTISYWLPTWFQAIKGATAAHAGIMNLPTVLGLVVASITSGIITKKIGYYTPFAYACTVLMSTGAGLFLLFEPDTMHPMWIGVQVLFGLGTGMGLMQGNLAAQTALPRDLVNTGVALMFFGQSLGGAVFVSVAQNILDNKLFKSLGQIPGVDPHIINSSGATDFQKLIPDQYRHQALQDYNDALVSVFAIAAATASATIFGSAFLPWLSVKPKPGPKKVEEHEEGKSDEKATDATEKV